MASVFEKYPNLPGFMSEFKDGGLQVRTEVNPPQTESVLLLGTAVDGPVGEPVAVDATTVELVFGRPTFANGLSNGSTLVKGFYEAYNAGCRDIRLLRITGSDSSALVKGASVTNTVQTPISEVIGTASGNAVTTFTLNKNVITMGTVSVNAEGVDLPTSAFTVTNGTVGSPGTQATVLLKVNVTNAGAAIYITYTDADATYTENGHVALTTPFAVTNYVAGGAAQSLPIVETPKAGTLKVYANGIELAAAAYAFASPNIVVQPGYADKESILLATFISEASVTEEPAIKLESIFGGSLYNQAVVTITDVLDSGSQVIGKKVVITKPEAKKGQLGEAPLSYSSLDYPSFLLMAQAINGDLNNNIVRASVAKHNEGVLTSTLALATVFTGGADGIAATKQNIYDALGGVRDGAGNLTTPGVYHLLENYTVDAIIPLEIYADDVLLGLYDNFAYQLALACAVISYRNNAVIGYIATSSPDEAGLAAVQARVDALLARKNDYFMRDRVGNILKDSEGMNIDLGRFIQVVAGPDNVLVSQRLGTYAQNSVAAYGGFVSQLAAQSSPTNKVLAYSRGLRFSYSNAQLDKLTEARYVTFKLKNNGANVAVTDAPTAAQATSDYRRLTTIRVVKESVNQLRVVCDPYLGEPNETPQRNAMSAAISKRLDLLKQNGVIVAYDFNVVVTPQMQLMGEAQIELTVVPPQELRRITTIVTLRPSL
jgi:hypothetical protein